MFERTLPPAEEMYRALLVRDTRYEGIFITAVRTTGIFCRPACPARKPARRNVEFFRSVEEALASGYRPCKRCRPLEPRGGTPDFVRRAITTVDQEPWRRLRDLDLRDRGIDPVKLRRWFNEHHGMTFQAYQRARRLGKALTELADGTRIARAAYGNGYESLSAFQQALRKVTGRSPSMSRETPIVFLSRVATPLGPMVLGTTRTAVCLLEFSDRRMLETQLRRLVRRLDCVYVPGPNDVGIRLAGELASHFEGASQRFRTPIVTPGSQFQKRVWNALRAIPYGETRSYAEQARVIGAPGAVRAVARANGDNRIAILIPCHRVVGADGALTGYGGGLWRKRWLLDHERRTLSASAAR